MYAAVRPLSAQVIF